MNVTQALKARVSTRAFLDTPVPKETLRAIFESAQLSPSNCNVQPWQPYIVTGKKKDRLSQELLAHFHAGDEATPDFNWPIYYEGIHKERQFGAAYALYDALDIARDDRPSRKTVAARNWTFFDAPYVVFFVMEKYLNIMGAVDIGIYAQSLSLLLAEHGLASCMQGSLSQYPEPIRKILELPDSQGILFGMSFGYSDPDAVVNTARTAREAIDNSVVFIE